jgi:hypothetical protein
MPAKIKDDAGKQLYSRSFPEVFPDGSEFSVYSSPENSRVVLKHSSGSHIEFKNDGSVVVKAVNQLLIDCGTTTDEPCVLKCNTNLLFDVAGNFTVRSNRFDLKAPEGIYTDSSGGDTKVQANNLVLGSLSNMSVQPAKSLYISTGEMRENVTTKTTEAGSAPNGINPALGGSIVSRAFGHHTIENVDPKGGLTLKSTGYTNILTAAERIDITGEPLIASVPAFEPTIYGRATYTHIVSAYPGPTPKGVPGSSYFQCGPGGLTEVITGPVVRTNNGPTNHTFVGPFNEVYSASKIKNVAGFETSTVVGVFRLAAGLIFLN